MGIPTLPYHLPACEEDPGKISTEIHLVSYRTKISDTHPGKVWSRSATNMTKPWRETMDSYTSTSKCQFSPTKDRKPFPCSLVAMQCLH